MRALLWIVGIGLVLIIGAALLLPVLVDEAALIRIAAEKIEESSGVKLAVRGDASLSLFPEVALRTSGVTVTLPDGGGEIEADYLQAGVALLPLLSRSVEMQSITVEGLTMTTTLDEEAAAAARAAELDTGKLSNAELDAFYAARAQARKAGAADAASAALAAPLALQVGELVLRDIRLRSVDTSGKLISELRLTQLTGKDLNTAGRPIPITAHLVIAGDTEAQNIDVVVEGSATVAADQNRATLNAINVIVQGATPDPVEVTLNGSAALDTQTADLTIDLTIGELRGDGKVRFDNFGSPMIDADLKLTELNPALLVLAGPDAAAAAESEADTAADGDAPLPLHPLRMVDTRARLAIERVVLGAHVLESVNATLRVVDGVADLKPVTATVHGGQIDFQATFNGRYNTAKLNTIGAVKQLDVASAVAAMEAGLSASGSADLTWTLSGSGRTRNELIKSLTGPIDFTTADITLQDIALQRMICSGVALVNKESLVAEFPTDTAFEALSARVQLANGVATLDPLTATLPAIALSGNGSLALDTQDLRASLRAQLSSELGEFDPACEIDERYTQLRWPVECRGNLAGNPASWCKVDTTEIVKELVENEAERKVKKEAGKLLKKLLD
jgi:uncharacterized protein involved in outer membrane biogenesis